MRIVQQIRPLRIMSVTSRWGGDYDRSELMTLVGHRKVEDIHPAHVFLSLPDKTLPPIGSSLDEQLERGHAAPQRKCTPSQCTCTSPKSTTLTTSVIRHPGAFCHKYVGQKGRQDARLLLCQLSARHRRTAFPLRRVPIMVCLLRRQVQGEVTDD